MQAEATAKVIKELGPEPVPSPAVAAAPADLQARKRRQEAEKEVKRMRLEGKITEARKLEEDWNLVMDTTPWRQKFNRRLSELQPSESVFSVRFFFVCFFFFFFF
jgi:hypothetical protein